MVAAVLRPGSRRPDPCATPTPALRKHAIDEPAGTAPGSHVSGDTAGCARSIASARRGSGQRRHLDPEPPLLSPGRDLPGPAAHLAVLDEAALGLGIDVEIDLLATVRAAHRDRVVAHRYFPVKRACRRSRNDIRP